MLFRADSITKAFGPDHILTDASIQINRRDAIGLIGVNGAGKTTFIRILLGIESYDTGEITRLTHRIGYLEQFAEDSEEFTVRDVLGRPYGHIENIRRRMREIDDIMASGKDNIDWNGLAVEYSDLEQKLLDCDIADEKTLIACMEEVGLDKNLMDRTMDTLSGGERTKVMLARIVVQAGECDMLIMDEPTSHLDIDTIEWLEDFLLKSRCAVLVVSHDRYFLDKMAVRMVEIENGKTREYKGNYSQFVMKKMLDLRRQEREWERYNQNKRTQQAIADRLKHDQWYAATYKTREKMIEKMEVKQKPEAFREIKVRIQAAHKSGKNVFLLKKCSIGYSKDNPILNDVTLDIRKGDKIGIYGANGQGKSTLIKVLLKEMDVLSGEFWNAPGNKVGYYSQQREDLDLKLSAEEQLLIYMGKERRGEARSMLARFLLFGEDVDKPMSQLSGGQRCRVSLAVLLMKETNVLILDEPTNYLDIPARHAIEEAVTEYQGTVITVTHDRYFLDSCCTSVIEVKDGKAIPFPGTYSESKGRPNITEIVVDADEYRVVAPFTNWTTGRKYLKGERVLVAPEEMESYQWALDQGKIKKTGGRERKKMPVKNLPEEEQ